MDQRGPPIKRVQEFGIGQRKYRIFYLVFTHIFLFQVTSLRQSVIERDRRIGELSDQHSQDLKNVREAQLVAQRSTQRFTTTVDHVLKVFILCHVMYHTRVYDQHLTSLMGSLIK